VWKLVFAVCDDHTDSQPVYAFTVCSSLADHSPTMSFTCFAAAASSGAAREDGSAYQFNAAAFPWLFDIDECARTGIRIEQLTPLPLNSHAAAVGSSSVGSCSGSGSVRSSGLELTMHESHTGSFIGSVVWEGGRVLAWLLETMHARVRELRLDGSGFEDEPAASAAAATCSMPLSSEASHSSLSDFTSPSHVEYLRAVAAGACFDIPRDFLVGARVLELGAGTGITGLACVKLGAREVVLTDIAELIPLMRENVKRNCPGTLRDEWRDTSSARPQLVSASNTACLSDPVSLSSAASVSHLSSPAPECFACTNCDDLCIELLQCDACDGTLCEPCDTAWHRPAKKSQHKRQNISGAAAAATSVAVAAGLPAPAAAAALPPLPSHCDVYAEELLWGVASDVTELAPSLRSPFDVIIMADVVYDAYSTKGVGSDGCDNFRRLFATLCMLCPEDRQPAPTLLLTYTPRRAPEAKFFELLATAFVWECYPATALLPDHSGQVDERIWIYHLHRSRMAGKLNAVKQQAYIHQDSYISDLQVRKREEEEAARRRERSAPSAHSSGATATAAAAASASSVVAHAPSDGVAISSSSAVDSSAAPTATLARHITPSFIRHLESEEQRQQAVMQARMDMAHARKQR
jgi:membrane-associated phospholipid phosphatase